MTQGSLYDINHLIDGYDWGAFDRPGGCVVDVGGGHSGISQALARATKHLYFVVQDLKGTVAEGIKLLPDDLSDRVQFMPHDFFEEQPIRHANIYFFRFILHNWSDKYAARILEKPIPAMKDGSRVVIMSSCRMRLLIRLSRRSRRGAYCVFPMTRRPKTL